MTFAALPGLLGLLSCYCAGLHSALFLPVQFTRLHSALCISSACVRPTAVFVPPADRRHLSSHLGRDTETLVPAHAAADRERTAELRDLGQRAAAGPADDPGLHTG